MSLRYSLLTDLGLGGRGAEFSREGGGCAGRVEGYCRQFFWGGACFLGGRGVIKIFKIMIVAKTRCH